MQFAIHCYKSADEFHNKAYTNLTIVEAGHVFFDGALQALVIRLSMADLANNCDYAFCSPMSEKKARGVLRDIANELAGCPIVRLATKGLPFFPFERDADSWRELDTIRESISDD